jgi:hypothetical protein
MTEFGEIIHGCSRAELIRYGELIDVSAITDCEGALVSPFKFPVAFTCQAFGESILAFSDRRGKEDILPCGQSVAGRLHDLFMVMRVAIQGRGSSDRIHFRYTVSNGSGYKTEVALWASVSPGDSGEPVITVMLPSED